MSKELLDARLLLQTVQHGDIPYSIPGIPGPNGMPRDHIQAAVETVKAATPEERLDAEREIKRIVYDVDEYGNRI